MRNELTFCKSLCLKARAKVDDNRFIQFNFV